MANASQKFEYGREDGASIRRRIQASKRERERERGDGGGGDDECW